MKILLAALLLATAPVAFAQSSAGFSVGLRGSLFTTFRSGEPVLSEHAISSGQAMFARYESRSGWAFELSGQRLLRDQPWGDYVLIDCWGYSGDLAFREVRNNYQPALGLAAQHRVFSIGRRSSSGTPCFKTSPGSLFCLFAAGSSARNTLP